MTAPLRGAFSGQTAGAGGLRGGASSPPPAGGGGAFSVGGSSNPSLSPADFDFVRNLVREKSAIVLEDGKEYLAESRLTSLARQEGFRSIGELVSQMRGKPYGPLHAKVVDAMTTNETSFFRDIHPFEALRKEILPELIEKRRATRELNVWFAASSSGQEPYSFALMVREHFPEVATSWRLKLLGSDISPTMVKRASEGRFSQLEVNRGLPAAYLVRYFERNGADWQVRADVRKLLEFRLGNLIEPWPPMPMMDLVLIRNVLIYFDRSTKQQILQKIRKILRPDGYLMLGSSETTFNIDDSWVSRQFGKTICYQAGKS